jgi:hypothetical protein
MPTFDQYKAEVIDDVKACLTDKGCQPILFVGSGVSLRYFNAPNWRALLQVMGDQCPVITKPIAYYEQSFESLRHVGEEFARAYKEWAWDAGKDAFPPELFETPRHPHVYLKYKVAEYLKGITPDGFDQLGHASVAEITALQAIRPHAVITTNYDSFLELVFPEYEPFIGQQILRTDAAFIGEIFKIHGCVTTPETLVLTQSDYDEFTEKKKYLSAKLLTYFAEHPMLLVGYNAGDPNVQSILSDIDLILSAAGNLIPNIYMLKWGGGDNLDHHLPREELISVGPERSVRIKSIVANDYGWVYDAFSVEDSINRINPKLLRGLLARTYDLVRHDIPKKTVEVDYSVLERAVCEDNELAKLYGITIVSEATQVNVNYPYTLTDVGKQLGFGSWHKADQLLKKVAQKKGVNLKASDNKYHVAVKAGAAGTMIHKYSQHAVDFLRAIRDGEDLPLEL